MLTDGKQIAAARQLLGWSQTDLAEKAGVSKPSIVKIESDLYSVKHDMQEKILASFSSNNIEFIDGGTRINNNIVQIIEGDDCYVQALDDVYRTLSKNGGEFLKSGANEQRSNKMVIDKLQSIRNQNIPMRSLLKNNDTFMRGPVNEYRWMDDSLYVDSDVKIIYGNKVGFLMSWHSTYRLILIEDEKIAEESRRVFNFIWNNSKIPTHNSCDERYTQ